MLMSEREIRKHVIRLVRETVKHYATTPIPTADEITKGLGLKVIEDTLPADKDGLLSERTIVLNSSVQSVERKQFTLFHEIVHYLLNQEGTVISFLHDATWLDKEKEKEKYEQELERLCNLGAAEFLMPEEEFLHLCKAYNFDPRIIITASKYFNSSKIAATIKLANVAPYRYITAVCEIQTLSDKLQFGFPLYVIYSASSPSAKYWLARFTLIPQDHPIHRSFYDETFIGEQSYIPFPSGQKMDCYCEAFYHVNRVYAIFHIDPPNDRNQLEFSF